MPDNADYVINLERRIGAYMRILEAMFGSRDPRFVLGSIKKSSCLPQLDFPNGYNRFGGCVVDICITEDPYTYQWLNQGTWQVAHECVHLLDPVKYGKANVLEEGLATWFQDEKEFHDGVVRNYIERAEHRNDAHAPNYLQARNLVRRCMTRRQLVSCHQRASFFRHKDFRNFRGSPRPILE